MNQNDGELLRLFQRNNDQAAFEALVGRHAGLVFSVCSRILADRQGAEDATQAVFLTLAQKAASLQRRQSLSTWLYQVAWHVSVRARAASRARTRREQEIAAMSAQTTFGTFDTVECEGLKAALDEELHALPQDFMQALVLHHLQGLSEEEGARLAGVKLGTFSARLSRAREMLRVRLVQRGLSFASTAMLVEVCREAVLVQPPAQLLASTVKAAVLSRMGEAAAAQVVSQNTLQMLHGALRMLAVKQMKSAAALTACVLIAALLSGMFYRSFAWGSALPAGPLTPAESKGDERPQPEPPAPQFVRALGASVFQAPGHVAHVAFSADEKFMATIGDKFVVVWDIAAATEVARTTAAKSMEDARFLKDGSLVILPSTGFIGGSSFLVWDWRKEKDPHALPVPKLNQKSPNDSYFLSGRSMELFPNEEIAVAPGGSANGAQLKAVDLKTGLAIAGIDGASRSADGIDYCLEAIAVSGDGTLVACADRVCGWKMGQEPDRGSMRFSIWDWKTKELKHEWIHAAQYGLALRWLPDQEHLLVSSPGQNAQILNASDGTEVRSFSGLGTLSADGLTVTTLRDRSVVTYSAQDGKQSASFDVGEFSFPGKPVLSPGGRYFVVALNGASFILADLKNARRLAPVENAHRNPPATMEYAADGRLVLYDLAQALVYDDTGARKITFKATMYRFGSNILARDGRLYLSHGTTDGKAEVWDTYTGKLLGHLAGSSNAVENILVSSDDRWALVGYEYSGCVRFFDLEHGRPLAQLQGPRHSFFGNVQDVASCIWAKDGQTAFIADWSARFFDEAESKKTGLSLPIGLAGAFDPQSGARKFWFRDGSQKEMQCVQQLDLNPAGDVLFIYDVPRMAGAACALVRASDGSFIKSVEFPGSGTRFSENGKLLAGDLGVVDVESGKFVLKFKPEGMRVVSPSRTLAAHLTKLGIELIDIPSGQMVWRCKVDAKIADSPRVVLWHPAETQLAVLPKAGCAVMQIDLFSNALASGAELDTGDIAAIKQALAQSDIEARQSAVQKCVEGHAQTVPLLTQIATAPAAGAKLTDGEWLERRMAVLALERIAREQGKLSEIHKILNDAAAASDPARADMFAGAAARLNASERTVELKKKVANPEPLIWPRPSAAEPNKTQPSNGDF